MLNIRKKQEGNTEKNHGRVSGTPLPLNYKQSLVSIIRSDGLRNKQSKVQLKNGGGRAPLMERFPKSPAREGALRDRESPRAESTWRESSESEEPREGGGQEEGSPIETESLSAPESLQHRLFIKQI